MSKEKKGVTRRDFLKGTAAGAAGVAGMTVLGAIEGCATTGAGASGIKGQKPWDAKPASVAGKVSATENHEVIVVGAGNTGIIAALKVAEFGGEVLILEQNESYRIWAGDIDAIDSKLLLDAGLKLDKEFSIHEIVRYASGKCDENLIRLWAYNSGAFVDWYQENLKKKGGDVMIDTIRKKFFPENSFYTAPYHTAYKPPLQETNNPMGSEIANPMLLELLAEKGGKVQYKTQVVELVQPGGPGTKVTGLIARTEDGKYVQYNTSRGVILATGGFLGNKDMMDQLGVVAHKYCSNHIGDQGCNGDGIKFATWAGAERDTSMAGSMLIFDRGCITVGGDGGLGKQGGENPNLWWPGSQPFLRVNALGKRFCNEDGPYDFTFNLAVQQPGHFWWQVFDSSCWEDVVKFGTTICSRIVAEKGAKNCFLLGQYYPCRNAEEYDKVYLQPNLKNGVIIQANSLDELADKMGVPKDAFLATVKRYNEVSASGVDSDHGKAPWRLSMLDAPPYYAVKLAGWALATLGGIHVDYNFNAITPDGKPIPGLYMSGNDVGNFFNGNYPQYFGGLCMGRCVTLAWLAAHAIMGKPYPTPVESARAAYAV